MTEPLESDPEGGSEAQSGTPLLSGEEGAGRHHLRWAFLCIAVTALTATSFLLFQLRLGMPLSFASTLLLAFLVAAVLPLLLIALLGKPLALRGFGYVGQYILICLLLGVTFASAMLI